MFSFKRNAKPKGTSLTKIVSLFDRSHNILKPWRINGFECEAYDIENALEKDGIKHNKINILDVDSISADFVIAFPPCTDFASSGARLWKEKGEPDLSLLYKTKVLASGIPLVIENPIGRMSNYIGKADLICHPYEFSGYTENQDDCYMKKTCLWVFNGAKVPKKFIWKNHKGVDENWVRKKSSKDFKRSLTSLGMAFAIYESNVGLFSR